MTEQMEPVGTDVRPADQAQTRTDEASEGADRTDVSLETGSEPGSAGSGRSGGTRRRRRGGRGRGRSGSATAPGPKEGGSDDEGSEPASRASGEGSPTEGTSTTTTTARRRRRRGGRGRGGRARSSRVAGESTVEDEAAEVAVAEPGVEPADPEPRPEVATLEAIDDRDVVEAVGAERGDELPPTRTRAGKRRRRGGRGRGRGTAAASAETDEPQSAAAVAVNEAAAPPQATAERQAEAKPTATRTRSRRSRAKKAEAAPAEQAEPTAIATAGPTRLRRGRGTSGATRRRREPMPVAPRVTDKVMVITEHGERDQIAILEGRDLVQHYVTRAGARSMVGNVYLGRVQNVLPGMEAAFVDVGRGRNAVLYAGEVNYSPEDLDGKQPPRIEQVLKSGQSVMVQVTKDPIGGKGARLTAKVSMPGRYLVLQPNWEITGISKRLPDNERRRLRALLKKIRPEGHGLIVRTAAEGATEEDLRADVQRLLDEWNAIEKRAKKAKAPTVLYEEPELTVRVVRDLFTDEEFRELVTDSQRVYDLVTGYLGTIAPDLLAKVRLHQGKLGAFEEFHIVEQIHKGLDRKVWLPSGGYLVIDRTEAMTVIDVNTGKSVGRSNLEETVVNTNIEAAREVARQLRLRDIGGMIIIDFIDMLLEQNKKRVVDTLKEEMARDKTRSQVFDISPLGLLEVTRKRVSGGLLESFSETCPTCEGRGVVLTYEA